MDWNTVYSDAPRITVGNSLYLNVRHGRLRYLKALLDRGVDVNCKNDFGENSLIASLKIENDSKRNRVFKYLLKKGADIHFRDEQHGRSVLLWVCYLGRQNELTVLLSEGGTELDIKEKDKAGSTCLHYATKSNSTSMVTTLVEMFNRIRESVDIQDAQGFTPYILARRLGYRDVANILQKQGNASPAQFDSRSFRTCREWSHYGKWERKAEEKTRQRQRMVLNKIKGDYKYGSDSSSKISESSADIEKPLVSESENTTKNMQSQDQVDANSNFRKGSMAAMSLLEMTSLDRGRLVHSYRQSEFDTSKSEEYKRDLFGDLNSILDVLAVQNSTSFRKSVKDVPKQTLVPLNIDEKPKVSSLAIIMGKRSYDGKSTRMKRKPPVVRHRAIRSICEESPENNKSASPFPPIQINNKVI